MGLSRYPRHFTCYSGTAVPQVPLTNLEKWNQYFYISVMHCFFSIIEKQ